MKQFLALLAATLALQVPAAPSRPALDAFLAARVAAGDAPAIVAMVVGLDSTLYVGAVGKANVAANRPVAPDSIFRIASMTKPVTSVAAMMLWEEGRLRLDDPVTKYLPAFPRGRVIAGPVDGDGRYESRPPSRPVTVRDLLTHTSGTAYSFVDARLVKLEEGHRSEFELPLLQDPGRKFIYGPSTAVIGQIVEKVSGQSLDAFFKGRIFDPLGMRDTFFAVPADKRDRVVTAHSRKPDGSLEETPNGAALQAPPRGDGGLFSTAADYARFMQVILNRGRLGTVRLLREQTVTMMTANQIGVLNVEEQPSVSPEFLRPFPLGAGKDKFGFGFQIEQPPASPGMRSAGSLSWGGVYNTHFWIDPQRSVAAVVLMQVLPVLRFARDGGRARVRAPRLRARPAVAGRRLAIVNPRCRTRTLTVMTTSTGVPFSSVGLKRHWRTASTAAIAKSGCTWALSTRTDDTVPSRPMTASIGTTPERPASRIDAGYTGRTSSSLRGARMLPPTRTGCAPARPGAGCAGAAIRLVRTVTVSRSSPTCNVKTRSQSRGFCSSNSWRRVRKPGTATSIMYLPGPTDGNTNRPVASVVTTDVSSFASTSDTSTPGKTPPVTS